MTLPEDIASALTDGVILCHLANYVRPRSVASIHVPSPGVVSKTCLYIFRNVFYNTFYFIAVEIDNGALSQKCR